MASDANGLDEISLQSLLVDRAESVQSYIQKRVPRVLRRVIPPEDIVQEVWTSAFHGMSRFRWDGPDAFDRWLITIANRKLLDALRYAQSTMRGGPDRKRGIARCRRASFQGLCRFIVSPNRTPSREASAKESAHAVRTALASLPLDYRDAIRMYHMEGRSVAVIAKVLHKSKPAVHSLLLRGRLQLRLRLGHAYKYFSDASSGVLVLSGNNRAR